MTPRFQHWRCELCRERGMVAYARSAALLLDRILMQHFERSPGCDLAPVQPTVGIRHDGHAWVLDRPQPPALPARSQP